jgi:hypothetical protein
VNGDTKLEAKEFEVRDEELYDPQSPKRFAFFEKVLAPAYYGVNVEHPMVLGGVLLGTHVFVMENYGVEYGNIKIHIEHVYPSNSGLRKI